MDYENFYIKVRKTSSTSWRMRYSASDLLVVYLFTYLLCLLNSAYFYGLKTSANFYRLYWFSIDFLPTLKRLSTDLLPTSTGILPTSYSFLLTSTDSLLAHTCWGARVWNYHPATDRPSDWPTWLGSRDASASKKTFSFDSGAGYWWLRRTNLVRQSYGSGSHLAFKDFHVRNYYLTI